MIFQNDDDIKPLLFQMERDVIWSVIRGFLNNLRTDEIDEARKQFCDCVNSIIEAYEQKSREVKFWKNLLKKTTQEKNKKIRQLEQNVYELTEQLDSKVCGKCGKKGITEQFSSLSVQENTNKYFKRSETETDGQDTRKGPLENEDVDGNKTDVLQIAGSNDKSPFPFAANIRCPYAFCGLVSLLCVLHKNEIYFCAIKLLLKLGAETQHKTPSCTKILNNLHELGFLKKIYKCLDVEEGGRDTILELAASELNKSGQKAGLLSYSTEAFNHCITVHVTEDENRLEFYDADLDIECIKDFEKVRILELIVLKCDDYGEPLIVKEWGDQCNTDICGDEARRLSKHTKPDASTNDVLDKENGTLL